MNLTDGQRLRQRLHEEFGALEFSPPPVLRVTGRGLIYNPGGKGLASSYRHKTGP